MKYCQIHSSRYENKQYKEGNVKEEKTNEDADIDTLQYVKKNN